MHDGCAKDVTRSCFEIVYAPSPNQTRDTPAKKALHRVHKLTLAWPASMALSWWRARFGRATPFHSWTNPRPGAEATKKAKSTKKPALVANGGRHQLRASSKAIPGHQSTSTQWEARRLIESDRWLT